MLKDDTLSLPECWETELELVMLQRPFRTELQQAYICSPCRADTTEAALRNMKAARLYMYYAYKRFEGILPQAPHAYLPVLLSDSFEDERRMALHFGVRLIRECALMLVCGDRLSDGMRREVTGAVRHGIPIRVFHQHVHGDIRKHLATEGLEPDCLQYVDWRLQPALSMNADELAPYWEEKT